MKALLLMLALAAPRLVAQEPTVSLKIDIVAWGDDIAGLALQPGKSKGDVTALAFRYSTPVSYSGPVVMEIYKTGSGAANKAPEPSAEDLEHQLQPLVAEVSKPAEGEAAKPKQGLALELEKRREKNPTLVALAALPASGCRRATVLLAPAEGGTFTAYVIDDDPSKLPLGQLRVHNLSPLNIAIRCNGQVNKELKTRETLLVPGQNGQLIYELAYKLGEEWQTQENNIIPVRETEQAQMLILKSENSFFASTDGSTGGFLQIATLRRNPAQQAAAEAANKATQ
jgi:hypothetical protein